MHVIQSWISRHHHIWTEGKIMTNGTLWGYRKEVIPGIKQILQKNMFNINFKTHTMKGSREMETIIFFLHSVHPTHSVWNSYIHDVYAHSFICKNKRRKLKVISQLKKSLHCDFILFFFFFYFFWGVQKEWDGEGNLF